MKKVTALKPQKRNRNRVNVYLDGEFAFGLSRMLAAELRVGEEVSAEKIANLQTRDEFDAALQRALRFLSYRTRSEAEIRKNLQKHHHPEPQIEAVLQRLRELSLVNDTDFALAWVENRSEFRPRGQRALRMELRQKGLSESVIQQALADLDEESLAYQAARKRAARLSQLEETDFKRKLQSFLARRGFPYETIYEVVNRVWDERNRA